MMIILDAPYSINDFDFGMFMKNFTASECISCEQGNDDTIVRGGGRGSKSYDRNFHRG